jgi:hypothetical protein
VRPIEDCASCKSVPSALQAFDRWGVHETKSSRLESNGDRSLLPDDVLRLQRKQTVIMLVTTKDIPTYKQMLLFHSRVRVDLPRCEQVYRTAMGEAGSGMSRSIGA